MSQKAIAYLKGHEYIDISHGLKPMGKVMGKVINSQDKTEWTSYAYSYAINIGDGDVTNIKYGDVTNIKYHETFIEAVEQLSSDLIRYGLTIVPDNRIGMI